MALFRLSSIKDLDSNKIDWKMVDYYLSHPKLMETLDAWVLSPDYDNMPNLLKLRELINKMQPEKTNRILYRGFILGESYQNTHGLDYGHMKDAPKGKLQIEISTPVSFTTDLEIAKSFGSTVIGIRPGYHTKYFLRMTDEISAALCRMRNIDLQTQYEWIYLPDVPLKINIDVVELTKPKVFGLF